MDVGELLTVSVAFEAILLFRVTRILTVGAVVVLSLIHI